MELISYAQAFVSFLMKSRVGKEINEIVLFGSVARGDVDKESDIDLFIEIRDEKKTNEVEKKIDTELGKFLDSKFSDTWRHRGIRNNISYKIGILEKWELERSVISDGITLYGKYRKLPKGLKQFSLFYFKPIKNVTKRNRVVRMLFGREEQHYNNEGLVKQVGGETLSPRSFVIPINHADEVINILDREKIDYNISEIFSDAF